MRSRRLPRLRVPGRHALAALGRLASRLFLIGSLGAMAFVLASLAGEPDARAAVMAVETSAGRVDPVGLSYAGQAGFLIAAAQLAAVVTAWLAARWGHGRVRRAGLLVLLGWAGLWVGNALWLAAATDAPSRGPAALILGVAFAGMGIRVLADWPRRHSRTRLPADDRPRPSPPPAPFTLETPGPHATA